jgi:hypothetical protein
METAAKEDTPAAGGDSDHGFSRLDLVKHSVKTIIQALGDSDELGIVEFSNTGTIVLPLTVMDSAGKARAMQSVERLTPGGGTNIWDGLRVGLELAKGSRSPNTAVAFLTDGEPTESLLPPLGLIPTIQAYWNDWKCRPILSTFGFGYALDSNMLWRLANEGVGSYAYIPDFTMVGTIFVNFISNLITTTVHNVEVEILGGAVKTVFGAPSTVIANIGAVVTGQARNVVVHVDATKDLQSMRIVARWGAGQIISQSYDQAVLDEGVTAANYFRAFAANELTADTFVGDIRTMRTFIDNLKSSIARSCASRDPSVVAFMEDLNGQVAEALARQDWFNKWGKHYIPSLMKAHQMQQCNNYKDPGVQMYAGEAFSQERQIVDNIFCKIPAPKPSNPTAAAPVDMSSYYNRHDPCFDGEGKVLMADGTTKAVKNIRKGDVTHGGARVVCVVRTTKKSHTEVCVLNGVKITPWHPVKVRGQWTFPADVAPIELQLMSHIYSFVLDAGHASVWVNGVECISLGHNLREPVAFHPYFGTDAVVRDLEKMVGWEDGLVVDAKVLFSNETRLASGMAQRKLY